MAVPAAHRALLQGDVTALSRGLAEQERCSGWRVHLHAMVHLEDFDVEILSQGGRRLADEPGEQIHAERHVAGLNDARMARGGLDLGEIRFPETGGADHMDDARLGGERGERRRCGRRREIEHAVRLGEDRQRIVGDIDFEKPGPGEEAGIVAERGRALALDGADEAAALRLRHRPDEHAPHPPGGPDHHESHLGHARNLPAGAI